MTIIKRIWRTVPTRKFARSPLLSDSPQAERSGLSQFHANLLCTKLVAWNQFLFYITCCSGRTLNMTYSESVFIALGIQHAEHSGFKHSVSCKRTLHKTGCLELFYVNCCIGKTLNITYSECIYSLRNPTCRTKRFQAVSFMQIYVPRNWLFETSTSFL